MSNQVLLAHGDGGILTHKLIKDIFVSAFDNSELSRLNDSAILASPSNKIAMSTDSFVVKPIIFPGGDIGKLAVCGTVNDLAVSGAIPKYLTAGFLLEEGMDLDELIVIVKSMAETARHCGVTIVTGDTKVVEKGSLDKIFINTSGVGYIPEGRDLGYHRIKPGDAVIINGGIGEHGTAILSKRSGISFDTVIESDCTPLNGLINSILEDFSEVRFMRDPTRGGLATTIKEIALSTGLDIYMDDQLIPINEAVRGATDMLGLDPLYLANEGKVIIIVSQKEAQQVLDKMKQHPDGKNSKIIGEVKEGQGNVYLKTILGGTKFVDMLEGAQLPRLC